MRVFQLKLWLQFSEAEDGSLKPNITLRMALFSELIASFCILMCLFRLSFIHIMSAPAAMSAVERLHSCTAMLKTGARDMYLLELARQLCVWHSKT